MTINEAADHRRRSLIAGYANYFEVGHNAFEFLIDFGQVDPQSGDVNFSSRIAVGPAQAKIFASLMEDAVRQFEDQHGAIPDLDDDDPLGALLEPTPTPHPRQSPPARPASTSRRQPVAHSRKR